MPRIAVPFFFAIAGYYYIKKITNEAEVNIKKEFWSYVKKLLLVYSLWSIIYIIIKFFQGLNEGVEITSFLKQIVLDYFINGSYYHLWFFPALFFAIIVVTFFVKIRKIKILAYISIVLYIIGCLGCSYFEIGNQIPFIKELINFSKFTLIRRIVLMGLPFFTMGYFINQLQNKIQLGNKMKYIYIRYHNCFCDRNYNS